ncbi:MAG TPA: hypothetical protein VKM72_15995 [Thermoanaerobaculia bacterium]|nr:hypothetical protein [Thermoanaerobaculia bacterium]
MTLKELIKAEVDEVPEERLDELYGLIQHFKVEVSEPREARPSLMFRLKRVKIDAPEDFAAKVGMTREAGFAGTLTP